MKLASILLSVTPMLVISALGLLIINSVAGSIVTDQLIFVVVGLCVLVLVSRIDYHLYIFSPWPWYIAAVGLLLLTLIIGQTTRGTVRWINIGSFSLQTSEFIKPLIITFMAIFLSQHPPDAWKSISKLFLLMLLPLILIFIQPNLGTVIILAFLTLFSLLAAGTSFRKIAMLLLVALLAIPIGLSVMRPYQRARIDSFLNPGLDPLGSGYNALQATIAVGSGRIFGRGLGEGTQSHLRFLPERYSDFIFASLVEELGLLGGLLLLTSYFWLIFWLIRTARLADTDTGSLMCLLLISLIIIQVLVNMGMNMGLLPITGITLPFVSHGGSSYLSFALTLGMCLAVAQRPSSKRPLIEIK